MPNAPIAELIRTRAIVDDSMTDQDVVVCLAANESELLERRPELAARRRVATRHIEPGVVLFLPAADGARLGARGAFVSVNRHVGG